MIANLSVGVTVIGIDGGRPIRRVLVYADEWITYTDQWTGRSGQYLSDPSCTGFLPQDLYRTSKFWYNMIHWAQPAANCFTIVDTTTPITIW